MTDTKLHNNTALLLFAQTAAATCEQKFLGISKKKNTLLWNSLNLKTRSCVQKTALPYFISTEETQIGSTFGEKLTHAIAEVFKNGYDNVIVIGNDCPQLTTKKILSAAYQLQHHDFVFGPDFNGGLYLTGITENAYNKEQFLSIPWQTTAVFGTIQMLYSQNSLFTLEKLNDLNSNADLKNSASKLNFKSELKILFTALLSAQHFLFEFSTEHFPQFFTHHYHNKGSPIDFF